MTSTRPPPSERLGQPAVPDAQLDAFVTSLAQRLASFDGPALAEAKRLLNRRLLPDESDLKASQAAFEAFAWPGTQARTRALVALGIGTRSDLEMRFGDHLPGLAAHA